NIAEDTVNTIGEGMKRLTWRTSYFFDGYQDVNQQINTEDYRFLLGIKQAIKNKDIIMLMIKAYVELLLDNSDGKRLERISKKVFHLSSLVSSVQLTQKSIVFAIQSQIIMALFKNDITRRRIATVNNVTLTAIRLYGYIEEAAISADNLKRNSPKYYYSLYNMEIEMLYFVIKPVLSQVVSAVEHKLSDDEIVEVLNKIFYGN
ncbi:MAG: hypothetical protein ACRDAL_12945, partial [Plesiomonas shigelloides]